MIRFDTWITSSSSTIKIFRKARRKHFSISSLDLHTCESAPFCHGFLSGLSKQSKQLNRYWSQSKHLNNKAIFVLINHITAVTCGCFEHWQHFICRNFITNTGTKITGTNKISNLAYYQKFKKDRNGLFIS